MRPAADTRINISKDDHCVSAVDTIDNASLVLDEIAEQKERLALYLWCPAYVVPFPLAHSQSKPIILHGLRFNSANLKCKPRICHCERLSSISKGSSVSIRTFHNLKRIAPSCAARKGIPKLKKKIEPNRFTPPNPGQIVQSLLRDKQYS